MFQEHWHRDVEESIRQRSAEPFIEEAVLQVSHWGFTLSDLQVQRKCQLRGILPWLRSMYSQAECELTGFSGPIHIWQVCTIFLYLCSFFCIKFSFHTFRYEIILTCQPVQGIGSKLVNSKFKNHLKCILDLCCISQLYPEDTEPTQDLGNIGVA